MGRSTGVKKTISMMDRYKIMGFIEQHCLKKADSTFAFWDKEAVNDQHVCELFKPSVPNLGINHVARMRQEMGLFLDPPRGMTKTRRVMDEFHAKLTQLEEIVLNQEARITALEDRDSNPKAHEPDQPSFGFDRLARAPTSVEMIDYAAGQAVAERIDPLLPKHLPGRKHYPSKYK